MTVSCDVGTSRVSGWRETGFGCRHLPTVPNLSETFPRRSTINMRKDEPYTVVFFCTLHANHKRKCVRNKECLWKGCADMALSVFEPCQENSFEQMISLECLWMHIYVDAPLTFVSDITLFVVPMFSLSSNDNLHAPVVSVYGKYIQ